MRWRNITNFRTFHSHSVCRSWSSPTAVAQLPSWTETDGHLIDLRYSIEGRPFKWKCWDGFLITQFLLLTNAKKWIFVTFQHLTDRRRCSANESLITLFSWAARERIAAIAHQLGHPKPFYEHTHTHTNTHSVNHCENALQPPTVAIRTGGSRSRIFLPPLDRPPLPRPFLLLRSPSGTWRVAPYRHAPGI